MRNLFVFLILIAIVGCSTKQVIESTNDSNPQVVTHSASSDSISREEIYNSLINNNDFFLSSNPDSITLQLLESSRQHYLNALDAILAGDTVLCETEFEYAIAILNELSYYPGIETNQEFNELSRTIIDEYEKYIAVIDSLSPETSIFALREKLNQIAELLVSMDDDTPRRIITTTSIPLVINGHVEKYILFFQQRGRGHFERWLRRGGKYFPMMRRIFNEIGIPEELIYLSMIESGLNPIARSWANAVGIWQFIKGTGRLYGLNSNYWYDERRDFEKATYAAARHLNDLYNEFCDWYLALAAYNSGAGRVYRAIRKSGHTDFWKIRQHLPLETRNYVPQYIAATVIALEPKNYGFDVEPDNPLEYDIVKIDGAIDLTALAECAETDATTIVELNPELLRWSTPPGVSDYPLRIPPGKADIFVNNYSKLPEDKKRNWRIHKVRKGETLASIAKRYGVSIKLLSETNKIADVNRLSVGKELLIPVPTSSKAYASAFLESTKPTRKVKTQAGSLRGKEKITYRIKNGDTLGEIAKKFGVQVSDLRIWNNLTYTNAIKADDSLLIWVPESKANLYASIVSDVNEVRSETNLVPSKEKPKKQSTQIQKHIVQKGDNLSIIAQRYNVTTRDLKLWNGLRSNTIIPGQVLEIPVQGNGSSMDIQPSQSGKNGLIGKNFIIYKVKKGDTLHRIAMAFSVTVEDLRIWNNIKGNLIYEGQELRIMS